MVMQKDVFLATEADAWFERNHNALASRDFGSDPVCLAVSRIAAKRRTSPIRLIEIGCGEGPRLAWLRQNLGASVAGIDPSEKAVAAAQERGLAVQRGTADALPFGDGEFDIVIFGFCLYLCDPQDLFQIAREADRVLRDDAWLVIHDFHAQAPVRREYHHKQGLYSHKMDFCRMFDWHPSYTCYSHDLGGHSEAGFTDDSQEWVATSVIRKRSFV